MIRLKGAKETRKLESEGLLKAFLECKRVKTRAEKPEGGGWRNAVLTTVEVEYAGGREIGDKLGPLSRSSRETVQGEGGRRVNLRRHTGTVEP